jgi:hypothetical protein
VRAKVDAEHQQPAETQAPEERPAVDGNFHSLVPLATRLPIRLT